MPGPVDFDDIDLNLLRLFDLVMRTRSSSEAARLLGRPDNWVSNELKRLRGQLGDQLFANNGRNMVPTERALQLHPAVRSALSGLRFSIMSQPRFDPAQSTRTFHIDIPVGGDLVLAPMLAARMAQLAPQIGLTVTSSRAGNAWPELQSGEIQLALDYQLLARKTEARHELLYDDPFVVLARKGHPQIAAAGGVTEQVFREARHVAVSWNRMPRESPVDRRLLTVGVERNCIYQAPTIAAVPGIVERTDCLAMLARRTANRLARQWAIEHHPCPFVFEPIPIYMVWHERFDDEPGHAWLRRLLKEVCDEV